MSKKGIVIAVPKKYEKTCLSNIQKLRASNCMLPIEIWEVGSEVSDSARAELSKTEHLEFKKVDDFCDNPKHWKGFQIKAFIVYHTTFQEVLLIDADVILHLDPNLLFEDENYLTTGAYFFRDLDKWQFTELTNKWEQFLQKFFYKKFKNAAFFLKRKNWLTALLPEKKSNFPAEWDYMYSDNIPAEPVKEALQESGVVFMDKEKHKDSLQVIYDLNDNHKETYQYVWGDKETFWIACLVADTEFYFNPTAGYETNDNEILTHEYKGKVFFSQKG